MSLGFDSSMNDDAKRQHEADEQKVKDEARVENVKRVAKLVLKHLGDNLDRVIIGDNDMNNTAEAMAPISNEIIAIMRDEGIFWNDKMNVLRFAQEPLQFIYSQLDVGFGHSWNKVIDKKFGKDILDVTLTEIDQILKS